MISKKHLNAACDRAAYIARYGSAYEKNLFLTWAHRTMEALQRVGNKDGIKAVSAQYQAFINAGGEE